MARARRQGYERTLEDVFRLINAGILSMEEDSDIILDYLREAAEYDRSMRGLGAGGGYGPSTRGRRSSTRRPSDLRSTRCSSSCRSYVSPRASGL